MPTLTIFNSDPDALYGALNVSDTVTFNYSSLGAQWSADVTDPNGVLSDDTSQAGGGENATADIFDENGTQVETGAPVDIEQVYVFTYVDPSTGLTEEFVIGQFDINDADAGNADGTDSGGGVTVLMGELPPDGTVLTFTGTVDFVGPATPYALEDTGGEYLEAISALCFGRGVHIRTEAGDVLVENLHVGDLIATRDHGMQPLRWVGSRKIAAVGELAPIVISKGALGNTRDLIVSPSHRMMLDDWRAEVMFGKQEVLVTARQLTCREDVNRREGGDVEYFHIMFDDHEIVYAEDAPSESFQPCAAAINSLEIEVRDEVLALFPELEHTLGTPARMALKDVEADAMLA